MNQHPQPDHQRNIDGTVSLPHTCGASPAIVLDCADFERLRAREDLDLSVLKLGRHYGLGGVPYVGVRPAYRNRRGDAYAPLVSLVARPRVGSRADYVDSGKPWDCRRCNVVAVPLAPLFAVESMEVK